MRCPNCRNQIYERLDYAIVRCTECMSLWDPFIYPGFPEPDVNIGEIWDTRDPSESDWMDEDSMQDDPEELDEEDDLDDWDIDDEDEFDDDWFVEDDDDWIDDDS